MGARLNPLDTCEYQMFHSDIYDVAWANHGRPCHILLGELVHDDFMGASGPECV